MKLEELYPQFKLTDMWGRELVVTARETLFTRQIVNAGIPGVPLSEETPISRTQFALLLLEKFEQLYHEEKRHPPQKD